jgi:ParB family chromosome partitioning protein
MSNHSLGRGLHSLIPKKDPDNEPIPMGGVIPSHDAMRKESIYYIEIENIKPNPQQPRQEFDERALAELAHSIREHGVLQPLLVSKVEIQTPRGRSVEYQLIAGERRLRAAKIAGLPFVPAVVRKRETDEQNLELAIIENVQREDLNPMERAHAYKKFSEAFGLTQQDIADRIGKSRAGVANIMRLLNLPQEIQDALSGGRITEGHARAILALETTEEQMALFRKIALHGISVRDTEHHVRQKRNGAGAQQRLDPSVREALSKIEEAIGTRVNFAPKKDGGRLLIDFYTKEELYQFLRKLGL